MTRQALQNLTVPARVISTYRVLFIGTLGVVYTDIGTSPLCTDRLGSVSAPSQNGSSPYHPRAARDGNRLRAQTFA